ncbi:MAG TPA: alpha/beta hydrolase [Bryobacteraceae bacterium]|nr:alpha/beta hydrolase [Bryobacteraceae bacterium]
MASQEDAQPRAKPIDEAQFIQIHGLDQWVTIRGKDLNNPALFILGGPGAALSRMAPFFAPWEQDFTLIQWDQPGAGATQGKNGDAGTGPLTLDRIARDGLEVADAVTRRLQTSTLVLLGISGGTIVALKMLKQRPDLFSAYVGTGQFVHWARQDSLSYAMVLEQARERADRAAIEELERLGPPPYPDTAADAVKSKYAGALTPAEQAVFAALGPAVLAALKSPPAGERYFARDIPPQDPRAQATAAYDELRPELMTFDARALGLDFGVPMFFFQGERDAYSVTSEVQAYAIEIRAPQKIFVPIEGGGHSSFYLRDYFLHLLNVHVRPVARPAG